MKFRTMNNNEINKKIDKLKNNKDSVAIFDFDYTLTLSSSNSSIGVFSNYLPESYRSKKRKIDFITNHIRNKHIIKLMWWLKIRLLSKYYSNKVLESIEYQEEFHLNKNTINILNDLINNNVDVIIYSSGMKQIIINVLKLNNIDIKRLNIIANDIDISTKRIKSKIITPKNKRLNNSKYSYVILFGDKNEDLKVVKNATKFKVNDNRIELYGGD